MSYKTPPGLQAGKYLKNKNKLDRRSIRSSPRYGLSTPYRLTIRTVLFNMGDLHLVLPALNLSTLNAGILIMMQQDFSVSPILGFWFRVLGAKGFGARA